MKHTINEAYLENIAKAAYEVNINVNVDRPWDHLYPDDKERWRQCGEAAIMAFLHPIMPTIQNAINAVTGAYPGSQQVLMMLDEILQMRVGIGLQSSIDVPPERPKLTLVPKEDSSIFEEIDEILRAHYPIIAIEDGKENDKRAWAVAVPSINYAWGVADSPLQLLEAVKQCSHHIRNKKQELLQNPTVHDAYVMAAQHNESVDDYYKYCKENNKLPSEYRFRVDIEHHDNLQWLVGTAVSDNVWTSTPEELMKAVKDQIEYIDTHQDEIKQLLGGHD